MLSATTLSPGAIATTITLAFKVVSFAIEYNDLLDCTLSGVLYSHKRLRLMLHPRNSFRVRRLSSHHPIHWATVSTHEAITSTMITGDVLLASMSSVPLFGSLDMTISPMLVVGEPAVLSSSCPPTQTIMLSPPGISFCCFLQVSSLVSSHTISIALTSTASKHNSMPANTTSYPPSQHHKNYQSLHDPQSCLT
jgi:hypothetical protein